MSRSAAPASPTSCARLLLAWLLLAAIDRGRDCSPPSPAPRFRASGSAPGSPASFVAHGRAAHRACARCCAACASAGCNQRHVAIVGAGTLGRARRRPARRRRRGRASTCIGVLRRRSDACTAARSPAAPCAGDRRPRCAADVADAAASTRCGSRCRCAPRPHPRHPRPRCASTRSRSASCPTSTASTCSTTRSPTSRACR